MNDVQSVVFDILKQFLAICEKLNLRYYVVNGSALGAVKYKGFIKWDDDVDVAMPREDYQVFCEKAQELLPDNLFLQNYRTDPAFPQIYSKIRNSDTTFMEQGSKHLKMNHGCYLDIFPLDNYSGDFKTLDKIKLKVLNTLRVCAFNDLRSKKVVIRNKILSFFGFHRRTSAIISRIESIYINNNQDCEYWCNYGDRQSFVGAFPKNYYGNGVTVSFEGTDVLIPEKYDEYFTVKYGDWRQEPPEEEQCTHHTTVLIDVNKPYTEYM